MFRTLSKMMPTQARSSSGEYDMALKDQLCRLAMSLKRFASERAGKGDEAGRFSSRCEGSFEAEDVGAS
jgi:hypothetical protein